MKEIVNRLHENRQIELAKSILEANGYVVTKKSKVLKESESAGTKVNKNDPYLASDEEIADSLEYLKNNMMSISYLLAGFKEGIEDFIKERGDATELDIPCEMLGGNYDNVYTISDQDEGGSEILEIFEDLEKKDVKREELSDRRGYCILFDTALGPIVYQNQWGMEVLFKKF